MSSIWSFPGSALWVHSSPHLFVLIACSSLRPGQFLPVLCAFAFSNFMMSFWRSSCHQIVLTSSLEDPSFHLSGIKYLNIIAHVRLVLRTQRTQLTLYHSIQWPGWSSPASYSQWATHLKREAPWSTLKSRLNFDIFRSKWKYQVASIYFGILMIYMIFASIECAIQATRQGGAANSIMVFSVSLTYGCKSFTIISFPITDF